MCCITLVTALSDRLQSIIILSLTLFYFWDWTLAQLVSNALAIFCGAFIVGKYCVLAVADQGAVDAGIPTAVHWAAWGCLLVPYKSPERKRIRYLKRGITLLKHTKWSIGTEIFWCPINISSCYKVVDWMVRCEQWMYKLRGVLRNALQLLIILISPPTNPQQKQMTNSRTSDIFGSCGYEFNIYYREGSDIPDNTSLGLGNLLLNLTFTFRCCSCLECSDSGSAATGSCY